VCVCVCVCVCVFVCVCVVSVCGGGVKHDSYSAELRRMTSSSSTVETDEQINKAAETARAITSLVEATTALYEAVASRATSYERVFESIKSDLQVYSNFRHLLFDEPDGYFFEYVRKNAVAFEKDRASIEQFLAWMHGKHSYLLKSIQNFADLDDKARVARAEQMQKDVECLLLCVYGDRRSKRAIYRKGAFAYFSGAEPEQEPLLRKWFSRMKNLWKRNHSAGPNNWVEDEPICAETDFDGYAKAIGWAPLEGNE
jgi:hypothetical protein